MLLLLVCPEIISYCLRLMVLLTFDLLGICVFEIIWIFSTTTWFYKISWVKVCAYRVADDLVLFFGKPLVLKEAFKLPLPFRSVRWSTTKLVG